MLTDTWWVIAAIVKNQINENKNKISKNKFEKRVKIKKKSSGTKTVIKKKNMKLTVFVTIFVHDKLG